MTSDAIALLMAHGAETIEHPGGTLLNHLRRVSSQLGEWGASPTVQAAGLCHAFYGTDGFPTALLDLSQRAELAAVIGDEAEELVYFYCSCDREFTYPRLEALDGVFRDRFDQREFVPTPERRREFVEITVVNELDIARVSPEFHASHGQDLLRLFTRLRPLMSPQAWQECERLL